jgi:eukaryotic-like serine/threonine-protein kinase
MTFNSAGTLIDALRSFRLISSEQYQHLQGHVQAKGGDPRPLAKQLVQRGWLTVFQINQLFAGHGKDLAIGAYRVLDRLGQGGLSQVFKAQHIDNDLVVALKVIRPEVLSNPEGRQQFMQEIEAMARLEHPNIVQFCDADQHEDTCYFAMEYVDGIDLGKHVRLSGPSSVREACDFIRQAALGLQHAHERNLVHRDIKPVNLFLMQAPVVQPRAMATHPGQPPARKRTRAMIKILDWGLAGLRSPRCIGPQLVESLSKGLVGTADYLSPEQARNASTVDIRGDIYSLGCTFYYLLTGQPPFPDGTLMQKILKHQQAEPPAIDAFRDDVPPALSAVLQRMLAKSPEDRFQTPAALAMALMPFLRGTGKPQLAGMLQNPKGASLDKRKDDTPLPIALGGQADQTVPRLSRAEPRRGADASADTARA